MKGTIHWVSSSQGISAQVRLYDRLFTVPEPGEEEDLLKVVNPKSLEVVTARLEPSLVDAKAGIRYAAASPLHGLRLGIPDHPPSRMMTPKTDGDSYALSA